MKKLLIAIILLPFCVQAQNISLSGFIKNKADKPLEMASVIAFKKGTKFLQSYSITNAKGYYKLTLATNQEYTINVSYLGYQTKSVNVLVGDTQVDLKKNISLEENNNNLKEVQITYEMPVKVVGDTIVYNSDSFTSGKEKKLGDVLKKLPGVDIDDNGEIQVEGKKVQKVLVEGKAFFDGDSKLASQNIPANAVDKVQVLKNYNEVSGIKSVTNNEDNIALNIKLKQGKKRFWFGDVSAGYGDQSKYIVKPKLFYYSPEKSINSISDFNNMGEAPFTMRDYFRFTGGLRSAMNGSGTGFNFLSSGSGFSNLQSNRAVEINTKFSALNFSIVPNKKVDYNGFALFNSSITDMENKQTTIYHNSGITENSGTSTEQKKDMGMLKFSTNYNPNKKVHIDYDLFGKMASQTELNVVNSNQRGGTTYQEEKPTTFNQNFNWYYTANDKNIFTAEVQHLYEKDKPLYNFLSDSQPYTIIPTSSNESIYNLTQNNKTTSNKVDAKFDYYYLLNDKSNINVTIANTYSWQKLYSSIFQTLDNQNSLNFTEDYLNNNVHYHFNDFFTGIHYKLKTGIFTFNPGVTLHFYQTIDNQLGSKNKYSFSKILPDIYARLQFNSSQSLRFTYNINTQFSTVNSLALGNVISTYRNLYQGNRNIENELYHSYSLRYHSFSMFSFTNIDAALNYSKKLNSVKNQTELLGVNQVSSPINSPFADETYSIFFRYGKTYSKIKTNLESSLTGNFFNNLINNNWVKSKSINQSYTARISSKFKNAPNFEIGYQKSISDYVNGKSYTDKPFANIEVGFLKNFILTADYSFYNYTNKSADVANNYEFLNANLYYQKQDSSWEFKLSANNLTNTKSINTDSYQQISDSNTTSFYFVQPRFFLFTIKYNL